MSEAIDVLRTVRLEMERLLRNEEWWDEPQSPAGSPAGSCRGARG